jgi:hypothetical protein
LISRFLGTITGRPASRNCSRIIYAVSIILQEKKGIWYAIVLERKIVLKN